MRLQTENVRLLGVDPEQVESEAATLRATLTPLRTQITTTQLDLATLRQ
jgi:ribosomal protein L29